MIEFRKARQEEGDDIIDFINYVFSNNSRPHDFKIMCPHIYDSDYPYWNDHYVAVEDGHIRATVAIMEEIRNVAGTELKIGHVEQVSVHPYHRGKGYMKKLLGMAIDDMIADGKDCSLLCGQRQRYEYFGYEPAMYRYFYEINKTNMRHVIGRKDLRVILSEKDDGYAVIASGEEIGTIGWNYIHLKDYTYAADAIEAYFRVTGNDAFYPEVALYDVACAKALSKICEGVKITNVSMIRVFNYRKVMTAALKLRAEAGLCADGEITLQVGDEIFGLRVYGNHAENFDTENAQYNFTQKELEQELFLMTISCADKRFPAGWLPLTF